MAACSMVNDTFLKEGKGKDRRRRKTGFISAGYLHTVNMKPYTPTIGEGHPNLCTNCPTSLRS